MRVTKHVTKRVIDGLQPRDKRYIVWDDDPHRFGVRVETTGRRTFIVDYNTVDGRRRRMVLGTFGVPRWRRPEHRLTT